MGEGHYWYNMCVQNGGYETFNDAIEDPTVQTWMSFLFKLPVEYTYTNQNGVPVHLTHSGDITGNVGEKTKSAIKQFQYVSVSELPTASASTVGKIYLALTKFRPYSRYMHVHSPVKHIRSILP